jgi:hypothetical protein
MDFNNHNAAQNQMTNMLLSPKSTRTQQQLGMEPFKSVEVTEMASAHGYEQQSIQNPS